MKIKQYRELLTDQKFTKPEKWALIKQCIKDTDVLPTEYTEMLKTIKNKEWI
jgi:hypothetical protein